MEPFMRSDQYHFIKNQARILASGHGTTNDESVLKALKALAKEKVFQLFHEVSDEQKKLLESISEVKDREQAEAFSAKVKQCVVPFQEVMEPAVRKLFPKVKKIKMPSFEKIDLKEISYIRWYDAGSNKTYLVIQKDGGLDGVRGTMQGGGQKSICALCNGHEEVELFMSESKKTSRGTSVKKGNYICRDSQACNENIQSLEKLNEFVNRLNAVQ